MKLIWLNLVNTFNVLFSRKPDECSLKLIKKKLWKNFLISWAVFSLLSFVWILFVLATVFLVQPILGDDIVDYVMGISNLLFIPMVFLMTFWLLLVHVNYKLAKNKLIAKNWNGEFEMNDVFDTFRDRLLRFVEVLPLLSLYTTAALMGLLFIHTAIAKLIPSDSWKYLLIIFTAGIHAKLTLFFFIVTCVLFITIVPFRLLFRRW
jgi:hypothetical protein